jgi:hypothetical protein
VFDTRRFLADKFKTPASLISFVKAYGVAPPKEAATAKWFQRGSVPSEWFAVLLAVLELDDGRPVSVAGYLKGRHQ